MDGQSYKLATKCAKGVKMGATALGHMSEYCEEGKIKDVMEDYVAKHIELAEEIDCAIRAQGRSPKDVGKIAEWFAVKGIEFKFAGKHDTSEVARSAVSGADKAISMLERDARMYSLAKPEITDFVERTIELERDFKKEMAEAESKD